MELLVEETEVKSASREWVGNLLTRAMRFHHLELLVSDISQSNRLRYLYAGTTILPRLRTPLPLNCRATILPKRLLLEVRVQSSHPTGNGLREFCREKASDISEFVYRVNSLELGEREGSMLVGEETGEVSYRVCLTAFHFVSSSVRLEAYLRSKVHAIIRLFVAQIENLLLYYKLPGYDLPHLEHAYQSSNSVPLAAVAHRLKHLRQFFDYDRSTRAQRSRLFLNPHQQLREETSRFMLQPAPDPKAVAGRDSLLKLKGELSEVRPVVSVQGGNRFDGILTAIEIRSRSKEQQIGSGGYASIFYGIYNYVPQISIDNNIKRDCETDRNDPFAERRGCSLVKKVSTERGGPSLSLQNECAFLTLMRNKVCPYLAKYYCNKAKIPFQDGEIYLQYYPHHLGECRLTEMQKLSVMHDVCLALLFLADEGIIHRDLKEFNVMVDAQRRGRLIDFGSVSPLYGSAKFRPKDGKLRSTEGYFLPYRQALQLQPSLENILSQTEYYTHRSFDLYGLGKILQNEFFLDQIVEESNFVRHHLRFLSDRCMEVNPEDRWTLSQVAVFLKGLGEFLEMRRDFWSWGFDPRGEGGGREAGEGGS